MESTRWRNCVDLQRYMDSLLQFAGYLDTPLRMSTRSYISSEEVFSSLNNSDSRPSNFLFQIARGSEATLSECTFFSKKAHTTQNASSRKTASRPQDKKNPNIAKLELFSTKKPDICSGAFQRKIREISTKDPQAPCAKQQEARGLHPNGGTFFFKKVHTTRRSHEALHGFTQESTRTMLFPTWQDLKEQDEASRTQPWSARGLVGVGHMGYPARKGEELA